MDVRGTDVLQSSATQGHVRPVPQQSKSLVSVARSHICKCAVHSCHERLREEQQQTLYLIVHSIQISLTQVPLAFFPVDNRVGRAWPVAIIHAHSLATPVHARHAPLHFMKYHAFVAATHVRCGVVSDCLRRQDWTQAGRVKNHVMLHLHADITHVLDLATCDQGLRRVLMRQSG